MGADGVRRRSGTREGRAAHVRRDAAQGEGGPRHGRAGVRVRQRRRDATPTGPRSHVDREINEAEAAVVRRIFQLRADGLGQAPDRQPLNADGAPTPRAQRGRPHGVVPVVGSRGAVPRSVPGRDRLEQDPEAEPVGPAPPDDRPPPTGSASTAPHLRIVSDAVWQRRPRPAGPCAGGVPDVDARGQRARPSPGLVSPYLLVGFGARAAFAAAALRVRSRCHGASAGIPVWPAAHYKHAARGSVATSQPSPTAARSDLSPRHDRGRGARPAPWWSVQSPRPLPSLDTPDTDGQAERATLAGELAALDAELARLTALAASGGSETPGGPGALRSRQARRDLLLARQAALARRRVLRPLTVSATPALRAKLGGLARIAASERGRGAAGASRRCWPGG